MFYNALKAGNKEDVRLCLDAGFSPNIQFNRLLSPLMCTQGNDVMELLLIRGADINWKNLLGDTALSWAIKLSDAAKTIWLLNHGADPMIRVDVYPERTIWELVCEKKLLDVIDCLLDHGVSADSADDYGFTILMGAAAKGEVEITKCLLDHGASLDKKDVFGRDALHIAIWRGKLEVVKCLWERYPAERKEEVGARALNIARFEEQSEITEFLLSRGAKFAPEPVFTAEEQEKQAEEFARRIKDRFDAYMEIVERHIEGPGHST